MRQAAPLLARSTVALEQLDADTFVVRRYTPHASFGATFTRADLRELARCIEEALR